MALNDAREVIIEASPKEILDVVADIEAMPEWSSIHRSAAVLERDAEGRPRCAKMKVKTEQTQTKFELELEPLMPLPGFVIKRAIKGIMELHTDRLRDRVLQIKNGKQAS